MESEVIGITAIVGEEGTGKTTMGLSFPRKIVHFDIDVGGFKRARWRIPDTDKVVELAARQSISEVNPDDFDILTKPFPKPVQLGKLLGQETKSDSKISTRLEVKFPRKVEGMHELWQDIVKDFVEVCQWPAVSTIILDSATMFWNIDHRGYLQELQQKQLIKWQSDSAHKNTPFDENDYRERLQPIEYGEPNDRMAQIFHTSRAYNKNLILTHYPTDVYGPMPDGKGGMVESKTGEFTLDGFKHTAKLVDLVVWTSIKSELVPSDPSNPQSQKIERKYISARIDKAGIDGMGIAAKGKSIVGTYESIINLKNMMKGAK